MNNKQISMDNKTLKQYIAGKLKFYKLHLALDGDNNRKRNSAYKTAFEKEFPRLLKQEIDKYYDKLTGLRTEYKDKNISEEHILEECLRTVLPKAKILAKKYVDTHLPNISNITDFDVDSPNYYSSVELGGRASRRSSKRRSASTKRNRRHRQSRRR